MSEETPVLNNTPKPRDTEGRGLMLIGVQRARSWRGRRVAQVGEDDLLSVRYRDFEALVRPVPYEMPDLNADRVAAHQRAVENAARRGTILPAPYGLVFSGRRALIRVLQDQYLMMDEALSFLDGQCEVRAHFNSSDGREPDDQLLALATQVYSELRRLSRAAIPSPTDGKRVFTAAFLVERSGWVEFVSRAEDAVAVHTELTVDVTGPWPPYDFVRFVYEH